MRFLGALAFVLACAHEAPPPVTNSASIADADAKLVEDYRVAVDSMAAFRTQMCTCTVEVCPGLIARVDDWQPRLAARIDGREDVLPRELTAKMSEYTSDYMACLERYRWREESQ